MGKGLRKLGRRVGRPIYGAVAKRLPRRLVAYPAAGGRLYLDLTDSPAMAKRVLRLYERPKRRALSRALRSGMTFVDVGANIGDFSLVAAREVGPSGRVLAVEPHPVNCEQLRRTFEMNRYEQIAVIEAALSDTDGEAVLHLGDRAAWHTLMPGLNKRDAGALEVPTRTLDSLIGEVGGPVHAMKVDVEGAELQVLRGAEKTLQENSVELLLDLHPHLGVDLREVEGLLHGWGYSFFDMGDKGLDKIPAGAGEVLARRV